MDIPFGVGSCLYTGISENIKFLKKFYKNDGRYPEQYQEVKEALEWYKDNCIVSYTHLKKEFDELTEHVEEVNTK